MKFDKKVEMVLKEAENKAVGDGLKSYGFPHIMLKLMETKDFQSAYTGDFEKLKKYVTHCINIYDYPAVSGLKGYDADRLANLVLPNIYKKFTTNGIKTENIILAHLFYGLCADCESLRLEDFLNGSGVNKFEVLYALATYCDIDSDTLEIDSFPDLIYTISMETKSTVVKKRKIIEESDEGSEEESYESSPFAGIFGRPAAPAAKKGATLKNFCVDLIEKAKTYDKPFIGREDVTRRTIQVLCKAEKSNPVHVGEPGVGKSAVTKGLAKKILDNDVPDVLKGSKLYELDLTALIAGTCYRGDFEKRIKSVLDELNKMDKPILFIDEIHMLIGAGAAGSGNMDAANILKPYLTEGKIKFIGATTYNEYTQYIEKDPALMRRFQKIEIEEPCVEDAIQILNGLKEHYEKYHKITYTNEAIRASVEMTAKYIHDRFLPDKAIDMIDEAGAYVNVTPSHTAVVDVDDIEEILCSVCKIPKKAMVKEEYETVVNIEETLNAKVFGQKEAVNAVSEAIKLAKSGLGDENKPIGSFLFVGPSGVGKTELAKQIANELSLKLIRFDMSEYTEQHSVAKLIGSPAGYVGYEDGGLLTKELLKNPHCVLLLDEVEKAHPDIFKTFLQMFDYGMLTDNKGHKVDCRQTLVIMTSNAGVAEASKPALGFGSSNTVNVSAVTDAVNRMFPVEFRNRLSAIVTFNGLDEAMAVLVTKKELDILSEKLAKKNIKVNFSEECIKKIAKEGTSFEYGARNLQRMIDEKIKKMFVKEILSGTAVKECDLKVIEDQYVIVPVLEKETIPA
jgi:ATP-dependent Clp protease ATP-binding subunit ClpA